MPFPYSYTTYNANNQTDFDYTPVALLPGVPVKDQLTVFLDGQLQALGTASPATGDYYIDLPNEQVVFHSAQNGLVKIARVSDIENKEVTFTNSAILTAQDLNKNSDQLLFLCQELYDKAQDIAITSVGSIAPDAVTEEKLNKSPGSEAVTTSTIRDGAVIEAKIGPAAVTETKIANDAVTGAKILNAAVTTAKIDNLAVTTAKIADDAVDNDKMSAGAPTWTSGGDVTVANDLTVTNNAIVDGNLSFDSGFGSTAVAYGCRAWVNFSSETYTGINYNRPAASTTVTITQNNHGLKTNQVVYIDFTSGTALDDAYTITGVTTNDFTITTVASTATSGVCTVRYVKINGGANVNYINTPNNTAGVYTVIFDTAMTDANYAVMLTGRSTSATTATGNIVASVSTASQQTTGFGIKCVTDAGAAIHPERVYFGVFR